MATCINTKHPDVSLISAQNLAHVVVVCLDFHYANRTPVLLPPHHAHLPDRHRSAYSRILIHSLHFCSSLFPDPDYHARQDLYILLRSPPVIPSLGVHLPSGVSPSLATIELDDNLIYHANAAIIFDHLNRVRMTDRRKRSQSPTLPRISSARQAHIFPPSRSIAVSSHRLAPHLFIFAIQ